MNLREWQGGLHARLRLRQGAVPKLRNKRHAGELITRTVPLSELLTYLWLDNSPHCMSRLISSGVSLLRTACSDKKNQNIQTDTI